jgi:hypothetical protein
MTHGRFGPVPGLTLSSTDGAATLLQHTLASKSHHPAECVKHDPFCQSASTLTSPRFAHTSPDAHLACALLMLHPALQTSTTRLPCSSHPIPATRTSPKSTIRLRVHQPAAATPLQQQRWQPPLSAPAGRPGTPPHHQQQQHAQP